MTDTPILSAQEAMCVEAISDFENIKEFEILKKMC